MSHCPMARNTPNSIDSVPRVVISTEMVSVGTNRLKNNRIMTYIPTALIRTPESMAETGEGAEEWASGNQA